MIARVITPLLALSLLAACPAEPAESEIYLNQLTAAPPTLRAEVRNPYDGVPAIELSAGVGVGIGCAEYCPDRAAAVPDCAGARIEVAPAELAQVHPVSLPGRDATFLLIAGEAGTGAVTVRTSCAEKRYDLRVVP